MAWLSTLKRNREAAQAQVLSRDPAALVEEIRTRARRRLIGAVVLVAIGIVGFPLVFETKPRPIPVDIVIELARNDSASVQPAVVRPTSSTPPASSTTGTPAGTPIITDTRTEPVRDLTVPSQAASTAPTLTLGVASDGGSATPAQVVNARPTAAADSFASVAVARAPANNKPASTAEAARALALLDGVQASKPAAGRFVVQVGAFAESAAANDTRQRVEKLGLKTYTQVALTPSGSRIRVRVGPFATRDEADRAQARAKSAGLAAVVLTL